MEKIKINAYGFLAFLCLSLAGAEINSGLWIQTLSSFIFAGLFGFFMIRAAWLFKQLDEQELRSGR